MLTFGHPGAANPPSWPVDGAGSTDDASADVVPVDVVAAGT
jgi:hypothetical protein